MYDFNSLIKKYSTNFIIKSIGEGHYDAGDWVEDKVKAEEKYGAILPLSFQRIYQSGGILTNLDQQLIMREPLKGEKVIHKDIEYTAQPDTDYSGFTEVYSYILKAVVK